MHVGHSTGGEAARYVARYGQPRGRVADVPTLVMHGDDDLVGPIAASALLAAERLPKRELEVYEGLSHGMAVTHAEMDQSGSTRVHRGPREHMDRFEIAIPDAALEDLKKRVRATRWPDGGFQQGDDDGFAMASQRELIRYWAEAFDWRAHEARLNALPQRMITIGRQRLHVIHVKGRGPSPLPLVLTHGWPGSFLEFERIIPLLTDPGGRGGDPRDAFDVVVPSLPGFGFSAPPTGPGVSARRIADLWAGLMTALGYDRFAAQGGDIGAGVSMWLARSHPERMIGVHLNYIPAGYSPPVDPRARPVSEDEQTFLDRSAAFAASEGAYALLQATKPQTLAYGLSDSPAGLAAWIAEKFHAWSDRRDGSEPIPRDVLLTNISLYWLTNTLVSSFRLYKENRLDPLRFEQGERVRAPLGFAAFPCELPTPPRRWVERVFSVARWTEMPRGGHFAALEQPELLAEDIRSFFMEDVGGHRAV